MVFPERKRRALALGPDPFLEIAGENEARPYQVPLQRKFVVGLPLDSLDPVVQGERGPFIVSGWAIKPE
jgi:hypothetical protein